MLISLTVLKMKTILSGVKLKHPLSHDSDAGRSGEDLLNCDSVGAAWLEASTFTITHSRGLLLGTRNHIEELYSI